ncbi:MAG: hypothetical protein ACHQ7M_17920, partial [Chloroflexota bacterium]
CRPLGIPVTQRVAGAGGEISGVGRPRVPARLLRPVALTLRHLGDIVLFFFGLLLGALEHLAQFVDQYRRPYSSAR